MRSLQTGPLTRAAIYHNLFRSAESMPVTTSTAFDLSSRPVRRRGVWPSRIAWAVAAVSLVRAGGILHAQSPSRWTVSSTPTVRIGTGDSDTTGLLAFVTGATRLPSGSIIVADRAPFSLLEFDARGRFVRRFARKGSGPGEIDYPASLFRCGSQYLTNDIANGPRINVYALNGTFLRAFRFRTPPGAPAVYNSACNPRGQFVHFAFENGGGIGVYRKPVAFWVSGSDSTVSVTLGAFPGSERWGSKSGSRPLPLGRQPAVAIGRDRVYVGTADRYEINVFSTAGTPLPSITRAVASIAVTPADVEAALESEISQFGERNRKSITEQYAVMTLPKTLPPYRALIVDAADLLWVQDFPRTGSAGVTWRVFGTDGRSIAEVTLPASLEVYEIGLDYVLGRAIDENDGVPNVRLYALRRSSGNPSPPRRTPW